MPYKLLPIIVLFVASMAVNAQHATPTPKPEEAQKLKKASLEFLKETAGEVQRMRSVENRISFSGELCVRFSHAKLVPSSHCPPSVITSEMEH